MALNHVVVDAADGIGWLTVNRTEVRNALDGPTIQELHTALQSLSHDPEVSVVVVTGAGERSFVSGADIKGLSEKTLLDALEPGLQGLCTAIEHFDKPVIAAINGYALGGGCELAMACDIRVASAHAKLGQPELNLAILPGAGGTQRLPRLVGLGKAKELIFTGRIITAEEAENIGLVDRVVPPEQLRETVTAIANQMIHKSPLALRMAKLVMNAGADLDMKTALLIEKLSQACMFTTEDKREGTRAFLEKRTPVFKGK